MVDKKLRERVDKFLERMEKYSKEVIKVQQDVIPEIVIDEIEKIFNINSTGIQGITVNYKKGRKRVAAHVNIVDCLISGMNPIDYATRDVIISSEDLSESIFWFDIKSGAKKPIQIKSREKLDEFLSSGLEQLRNDETFKFIVEENTKLYEEAKKLKQEIAKRIEEPWKI
jgi:hypothetical protein